VFHSPFETSFHFFIFIILLLLIGVFDCILAFLLILLLILILTNFRPENSEIPQTIKSLKSKGKSLYGMFGRYKEFFTTCVMDEILSLLGGGRVEVQLLNVSSFFAALHLIKMYRLLSLWYISNVILQSPSSEHFNLIPEQYENDKNESEDENENVCKNENEKENEKEGKSGFPQPYMQRSFSRLLYAPWRSMNGP